jgi:general secretion pathway protein A
MKRELSMYHQYYQLKENPFNVTADPEFFYSSAMHSAAISNLLYGIEQRKGIMVITGEVGTGKTTLCRKLLRTADSQTKFALILNPKCSELQMLQMIIQDLDIKTKAKNKFGLIEALNQFLLHEASLNHNVVVVVDEAQNLTVNQLEQVRLLSNLETEKEKLLQIVLVGQPELHQKLQLPALRQVRQRIAVYFPLEPLERDDIKSYIEHRLNLAVQSPSQQQKIYFTEQAIDRIYYFTQGSPRTINMICDRALLAGFVAETRSIDQLIIENCAKEVLYCEHYL